MSLHSPPEQVRAAELQLRATSAAVQQATNCIKAIDTATRLRQEQSEKSAKLVQQMRMLVSIFSRRTAVKLAVFGAMSRNFVLCCTDFTFDAHPAGTNPTFGTINTKTPAIDHNRPTNPRPPRPCPAHLSRRWGQQQGAASKSRQPLCCTGTATAERLSIKTVHSQQQS